MYKQLYKLYIYVHSIYRVSISKYEILTPGDCEMCLIRIFSCGCFAVEVASVRFSSADGQVSEKTFLLDRGRLKLDILKSAFACPYLILDLGECVYCG